MAAARQVLERSTMMLLTSSKACLRHPECPSAKENRDTVFCQMRRAMDLIHYVVKDGVLECNESQSYSNAQVCYTALLYVVRLECRACNFASCCHTLQTTPSPIKAPIVTTITIRPPVVFLICLNLNF